MRKPKKEIHLTSYEELLGIEDNQENSVDKITEIPMGSVLNGNETETRPHMAL